MKVLVACEESQEVCKAFRERGHEAYSCDLQECSGGHPEWHIHGNVLPLIRMGGVSFQTSDKEWHTAPDQWDLVIAHPPCTYLAVSGNKHFSEDTYGAKAYGRYMDRMEGIKFFMEFTCCNAKRIAIENPIGIMSSVYRSPDQIIQPYEFGHPAKKSTCLWLKNLPKLVPTDIVEPDLVKYQCKDGKVVTFSADYGVGFNTAHDKRRSKTYPGVAEAMASQWG